MKNFKYNYRLFIAALLLAATGCTKKFNDANTNPYNISEDILKIDNKEAGDPLVQVQQNIYVADPVWYYQVQQNLNADLFSGYLMHPSLYLNNVNNSTYSLVDGWNGFVWDAAYGKVMPAIRTALQKSNTPNNPIYSWAKILKVEAMHRVTDVYGPIVYSKYGQLNTNGSVDYDSQKDVYYAFFSDLDSAITVLTGYAQTGKPKTFDRFDLVYGGDYTQWVKFANTLRLRLALRIVKIDAQKAKTEGEKALAHPLGLLTANTDRFQVDVSKNIATHPLDVIADSWGDIRLGAAVESIMGGYDDPRLSKYARPATDAAVAGQYKGIRQGINIDNGDRYRGYSKPALFSNGNHPYLLLMSAAEAWFLKAEAAIRGWTGAGDAKANYEAGIKTSFDETGVSGSDAYINNSTSKPKAYVDPKAITPGQNDVPTGSANLSTITIRWDNAATFEQKLERIITQKWIAMYPEGQEAWSEFRRTGYPKLFPVVVNNSGGLIPSALFIRRLNFPSSEKGTNAAGVQRAVTLLGGQDNGGTRLWWDKL